MSTETWEREKAGWENKLWEAQLKYYPDSVRMTLKEVFLWCNEPEDNEWRSARWVAVALALQHPARVFYKLNSEDTGLRGYRYGFEGYEYFSGFEYMKGD